MTMAVSENYHNVNLLSIHLSGSCVSAQLRFCQKASPVVRTAVLHPTLLEVRNAVGGRRARRAVALSPVIARSRMSTGSRFRLQLNIR
ncbi:hypothetical protein EVAR_14786_1 [Eumeta japonica]|uniref:Uncharacterized protein n=1 Tax=Eumeta variegata TaxID=151549 RepID=A0A4C1TWG4_EUMVA|nr:hypothetical protein EVAR_14786_1 [Eumeta japonica]